MDNRHLWKSLATGAVFSLVAAGVAGLLLASFAMIATTGSFVEDPIPEMRGPGPIVGGFLIGFVFFFPVALVNGLGLAIASLRIRSAIAWLGWATLSGALLSFAALLLVLMSIVLGQSFEEAFWTALSMSVIGTIGSAAAGLVTMGLRPRLTPPPIAQTFA